MCTLWVSKIEQDASISTQKEYKYVFQWSTCIAEHVGQAVRRPTVLAWLSPVLPGEFPGYSLKSKVVHEKFLRMLPDSSLQNIL
jgi:hypothetical protein